MLALYIVAGIGLFVLLVFSIPVDMVFNVGGSGAARSRMRVGWLFGLLGKEFGRGKKKPEERAPKRKKTRGLPKLPGRILSGVRVSHLDARLGRGLLKLSRRILSGVRVSHLDAHLRIGLDDPADTGLLYAALWPVIVPLTHNRSAKVRIELAFEEPVLDLTARGRIRVYPIQMVWYVLLFALSPAGLGAMKRMVMRR